MELKYSIFFRNSPLYDENENETLTFLTKDDGVWSNGIENAKFFTDEDEFVKVKTELDEIYVYGGFKSFVKEIILNTQNEFVHVYFHSIPIGTKFEHKKELFIKIDNEKAKEIPSSKKWTFESHYVCVIDKSMFNILGLTQEDIRPL